MMNPISTTISEPTGQTVKVFIGCQSAQSGDRRMSAIRPMLQTRFAQMLNYIL
jgi:hypothetical protein